MARPPSKRKLIMTKLTDHLAGITPDNGYDHDLTGRVSRGRATYGPNEPRPFLSILEAPKPSEPTAAGDDKTRRNMTWDLMIQGFVTDDKANPLDPAYDLLAEVELRLSEIISESNGRPTVPSIYRLANLATDVLIGHGVCRPELKDVSPTAFFYLPLTIKFKHDLTDPFTP